MFFQVQVNLKGIQMSNITIFHRVFLCGNFPSCGPLYSTYGLSHPSLWHKFFWMYLLMTFKYWTCLDMIFSSQCPRPTCACKMKWWVIMAWYLAKKLGKTKFPSEMGAKIFCITAILKKKTCFSNQIETSMKFDLTLFSPCWTLTRVWVSDTRWQDLSDFPQLAFSNLPERPTAGKKLK